MKTLLLVDDSLDVIEILEGQVNRDIWNIKKAFNVEEAKKLIQNGEFDLIVTDYNMPDGTGLDVLNALIEAKKELHTQIVLHTSDYNNFNDRFKKCFVKFERELMYILMGREQKKVA